MAQYSTTMDQSGGAEQIPSCQELHMKWFASLSSNQLSIELLVFPLSMCFCLAELNWIQPLPVLFRYRSLQLWTLESNILNGGIITWSSTGHYRMYFGLWKLATFESAWFTWCGRGCEKIYCARGTKPKSNCNLHSVRSHLTNTLILLLAKHLM